MSNAPTNETSYETIVIDPPWPGPGCSPAFGNQQHVIPYATMSGIQVAALQVHELASPTAQLFIWATSRGLGDAYLLAQVWGFKYRGLWVWKKPPGLGRHIRHDSEFLLWAGRKGAPLIDPKDTTVQTQTWPRRAHSQKPAEAYAMIRELSKPPRLDIFAREQHEGFERWGNELQGSRGLAAA